MTTPCPSDLLEALARHGVRVYLKEGRLTMRHPWPDLRQAPPEVAELLRWLKAMRAKVKAYLHGLEDELGPGLAVAFPPSLRPDGTCWACRSVMWWLSVHNVLVCAVCHPPAHRGWVARWVPAREAATLKRTVRAVPVCAGENIPRGILGNPPEAGRPWLPPDASSAGIPGRLNT